MGKAKKTAEHERLSQARAGSPWYRWGPYLSERSWGTVREDYSANGAAWNHLTHDMARSKAYRWGEDGLAGVSDQYQLLCFSLALWNGRDPILKERAFGLIPAEGNHGEDLKEYYFYIDSTPTHSYMKYLYKYPQAEYPYEWLVRENASRQGRGPEFELLDTGTFDEDRYFDVFVEYAKEGPEDLCVRVEVCNRGPDDSEIHLIPQLWFRNIWSWDANKKRPPNIKLGAKRGKQVRLVADDSEADGLTNLPFKYQLGKRYLSAEADGEALFTDNESNVERLYGVMPENGRRFYKDAFHRHIIHGETAATNHDQEGTKAGIHYRRVVPARGSVVFHFRLSDDGNASLSDVDSVMTRARREADEFYQTIHPKGATEDECRIQRQAFAGMMWSKQNYIFDVEKWLKGDNPNLPPPESRNHIRNQHWRHLNSMRVLSMPDKWEYPWFAAWDLAFHTVAIAIIDPDFAKQQLWLMLFEQFQHPNGQIPAYEWEFSDLNPPVHPWAVWRVYNMDRIRSGTADRAFLERCFHKLLINFAWWINKVDSRGNNVFEGGFLGLDNITLFDRSEKLPGGAVLEQSDATGWMGLFCLNMMRIALELAKENKTYESLATKFFQHYVYIGAAMKRQGGRDHDLWDDTDGFFYDVLRYPDGRFRKFRVRSLVGLIPLFAVERLEAAWIAPFKEFSGNLHWFLTHRKAMVDEVIHRVPTRDGSTTHLLTIVNFDQLRRMIIRLHDAREFLAPGGIRSLSRTHLEEPFEFDGRTVGYEPAESVSKLKGGNSNWRGPIWFPTNFLIVESLRKLGTAFGPEVGLETPAAPAGGITLREMARDIARRLVGLFLPDGSGRRPIWGGDPRVADDPLWRDELLFHEYFHGDTGAGLGASHQTGWTALVASLIDEWPAR